MNNYKIFIDGKELPLDGGVEVTYEPDLIDSVLHRLQTEVLDLEPSAEKLAKALNL